MISKQDVLVLLKHIQSQGIDTSSIVKQAIIETIPSLDTIKYIDEHRPFDLYAFYEKLRRSYNQKRSKLYINIVKEIEAPQDVLVTLASLSLQILLFKKEATDPELFIKSARLADITRCLTNYAETYDILPCVKLLQYIKADLKAFEFIHKDDESTK